MNIGETGRRLSDRFGEHFRSVESFSHNTRYQGGGFPVAGHFNHPNHGGINDMRVSVLEQTKGGTQRGQREERRLIAFSSLYARLTSTFFVRLKNKSTDEGVIPETPGNNYPRALFSKHLIITITNESGIQHHTLFEICTNTNRKVHAETYNKTLHRGSE